MLLTLVLNHIVPLISYSFSFLFRLLWSEDDKPLVIVNHVLHQRPVISILRHIWHWKPIFHQTWIIENVCQSIWCWNVVFQDQCYNFWWISWQEGFYFLESVYSRFLQCKETNRMNRITGITFYLKITQIYEI